VIRHWTQADIDYVEQSVNREGWGHTRRDVERCWSLEPKGCFIAVLDNKPVGHVFSVCYGKIGWIGLLIVNSEMRGQGIGSTLMTAAIKYVQAVGAKAIELEAVESAVPLYRSLGFVEEFDSLRFVGQLQPRRKYESNNEATFQMREDDLNAIAEFDSEYFGANRLSVLKKLHTDQPHYCFVAGHSRNVSGYIMARKTQDGFWIGPWVCKTSETAQLLFNALTDIIKEEDVELRVGMPVLNKNGRRLMEKLGFKLIGKSIHMIWGKRRGKGDATGIYGIGGPEKG